MKELKPGKEMKEMMILTRDLVAKELTDLKLVTTKDVKNLENKSRNFKKYYPHDVSHFLGLDVHDVGDFDNPLEAGMVLTVEPGIYIKEESLGVRLENDVLITDDGYVDLMKDVPVEPKEIEQLMNRK